MKYLLQSRWLVPVLLGFTFAGFIPTSRAFADCNIVWTQECSSEVVITGQDTYRISGTTTVHDYHEDWGEDNDIVTEGYWNPIEGELGVRWDCSSFFFQGGHIYGAGIGVGWKLIYQGGEWREVTEDVPVDDRYGRSPGERWWIPTYEERPVIHRISAEVCLNLRENKIPSSVRWRDTRDEFLTIPFQDFVIIPWEKISVITNYYQLEVPLPYPAAQVVRNPWPRAIAGQPVHFTAAAAPVEAASETIDACTPDILNFQLHVRLTPIRSVLPEWDFDERPWSTEPGADRGWEVTHTFQTASFNTYGDGISMESDKPALGPSLDGLSWLPSYKVNLKLAWLVEANRTWIDFHGNHHETGWQAVDLTQYGYNTPYLITTGARDVTTPPPGIPAQDLPDYFVPVPVVESQGILTAP